ncbi:hypothetical protein WJR50_11165 [Catalinimonas sp. 4WD22]|uniref:hypothetical protein n=1 Tax=Catalinimonas locisalis TaxID=3133978 RepID=UPI0031012355
MKSEVAVIIKYKGSGFGSSSELKKEYLDTLKLELKENYITNSQDIGGPQAGGIVDTIVEIFTNQYFQKLTGIIKDGLIFDLIFNGRKSIVLKPLVKAFQKIESKTDCWDYTQVRFYFDDTVVVIYGSGKLFTSVVGKVFPELIKHIGTLGKTGSGMPSRICMPIQKANWVEGGVDKWISPAGDGEKYSAEECLTFWGLEFGSRNDRKIYDVQNQEILNIEWD